MKEKKKMKKRRETNGRKSIFDRVSPNQEDSSGVPDAVEWSLGHPWLANLPSPCYPCSPLRRSSCPSPFESPRVPSPLSTPAYRVRYRSPWRDPRRSPSRPAALALSLSFSRTPCSTLSESPSLHSPRASLFAPRDHVAARPRRGVRRTPSTPRARKSAHGTLRCHGGSPVWRSIRDLRNSATPCATRLFSPSSSRVPTTPPRRRLDLVRATLSRGYRANSPSRDRERESPFLTITGRDCPGRRKKKKRKRKRVKARTIHAVQLPLVANQSLPPRRGERREWRENENPGRTAAEFELHGDDADV